MAIYMLQYFLTNKAHPTKGHHSHQIRFQSTEYTIILLIVPLKKDHPSLETTFFYCIMGGLIRKGLLFYIVPLKRDYPSSDTILSLQKGWSY